MQILFLSVTFRCVSTSTSSSNRCSSLCSSHLLCSRSSLKLSRTASFLKFDHWKASLSTFTQSNGVDVRFLHMLRFLLSPHERAEIDEETESLESLPNVSKHTISALLARASGTFACRYDIQKRGVHSCRRLANRLRQTSPNRRHPENHRHLSQNTSRALRTFRCWRTECTPILIGPDTSES